MADPIPGKRLAELSFLGDAIGAELYGEKGGQPWRIKAGEPNGLQTLDEDGKVPLEQIPDAIGNFTQSGVGADTREVRERLRDTLHAADFGVVGDNLSDNSDWLDAVVREAKARRGAVILLPPGDIRHSRAIIIDESNISLVGSGDNMAHDAGSGPSAGTALIYTGASIEAQVKFHSPTGATAQKKSGGGLENVWLYNASGNAQRGLLVRSYNAGKFENVWIYQPTTAGVQVDVASSDLAEAKDSQRNRFVNVQVEAAGSAACWYLEGGPSANASFNYFQNCGGRHANGHGWILGNSDNNLFIQCGAFRVPGGTGYTVELRGANPGNAHARSNHFVNLSGNGGVIARGTTSYTTPSERNSIAYYDQDNSSPLPTIETGAQLSYVTDDSVAVAMAQVNVTLADGLASAKAQRAARGNETVRIVNGSDNHIRITDGTHEWAVRITAADGTLRLDRIAGTGFLMLGGDVQFGDFTSSADAAVNGYVAIKDAAGNVRKLATIA